LLKTENPTIQENMTIMAQNMEKDKSLEFALDDDSYSVDEKKGRPSSPNGRSRFKKGQQGSPGWREQ
jgi:hypothetical protein